MAAPSLSQCHVPHHPRAALLRGVRACAKHGNSLSGLAPGSQLSVSRSGWGNRLGSQHVLIGLIDMIDSIRGSWRNSCATNHLFRMKRTTLLALPVCLLLSACATPKANYIPKTEQISRPPLNTEVTVSVGDEMLRQGVYTEREAIRVTQPIKMGGFASFTIFPGVLLKVGEDAKREFFEPSLDGEGARIEKCALCDPWKSVSLNKKTGDIGVITVFNVEVDTKPQGIMRTTHNVASDKSFQQTLIYSGKVGTRIRIGYREFANDIARPAFSNDAEYDLNESRIIGYKGARIEVIEATNQSIRYVVLQNFNSAKY